MKPLGDLAVQRRRAGHKEADTSTENLTYHTEHQAIEQLVLKALCESDLLTGPAAPVYVESHGEGLFEQFGPGSALSPCSGDDTSLRLLEDSRRGSHESRLNRRAVLDDLVHPAAHRADESAGELGG